MKITFGSIEHSDLYFALRTRVLTQEELGAVMDMGSLISIFPGRTYRDHEREMQYSDALFKQGQLRLMAAGCPANAFEAK